jgi:hypothetical protein
LEAGEKRGRERRREKKKTHPLSVSSLFIPTPLQKLKKKLLTQRLAAATGGEIASTFDDPGSVRLGRCDLIEEIMIGDDRAVHFSGCARKDACTIVLRCVCPFFSFFSPQMPSVSCPLPAPFLS